MKSYVSSDADDESCAFLFITYALGGGGAERAMLRFANALAKRGHEVWVYCYERLECEYEVAPGVRVVYSTASRLNGDAGKIKKYFVDAVAVRRLCRHHEFDYVIPFCTEMVICTFFGLLGTGLTVIATERNNPVDGCKGTLKRILRDFSYRHCDAVWVQNNSQRAFYEEITRHPVFVVPNIVEMQPKTIDSLADISAFMTVGRLFPQKNQRMLLEAFVVAHNKHPEISLDVYGSGPLEHELSEFVLEMRAGDYIHLRGHCAEVYEELRGHDAFCFSSDFEGLPNALIEAMLVGLPVVTTDFETGSRDLVTDGKTGHMVHRGDVEAFSAAVIDMVENPKNAISMATSAREFLTHRFCEERLVDLLIRECKVAIDE